MADTYFTLYGAYHLAFQKVSVTIGGLDCGDVVAGSDGSVVVSLGQDTGGLLTAEYIASLDGYAGESAAQVTLDSTVYTIPVVIGAAYTSQAQGLRPATADDLKSPSGGALGKMRRVHRIATLLQNCLSGTLFWGTSFANLTVEPLRDASDAPGSELDGLTFFNGVNRYEITDDYSFDGAWAVQVNRPVPATVVQVSSHLEGAEG